MTQPLYSSSDRARDLILGRLAQIETDHSVEIVFAVESGSRAWGFSSEDSDWDVRFVYRRRPEEYLRLIKSPDTIGKSVKGALYDVHGWDVGKALLLGLKSNATLLEWTQSPVIYRWSSPADDLKRCLSRVAERKGLVYNYYNLARTSVDEIAAAQTPKMKTYLYGLRAALALRYMRMYQGLPPMNITELMEGAELSEILREPLLEMIAKKSSGQEHTLTNRKPVLDTFLADETELAGATKPERSQVVSDEKLLAQAENLYRQVVGF